MSRSSTTLTGQRGQRHDRQDRSRRAGSALAIAVLAMSLAACTPEPPTPGEPADALSIHVLSRAGYGPDAWSLARIRALGAQAYLEEQLEPASIVEDPALVAALGAYPSLQMGIYEILANYGDHPGALGDGIQPLIHLMKAKMLRSIHSRRQLEQVLTDFWFDHFNVFGADGFSNYGIGPYERDAIRPHVLGRFEDMLVAVARNPSMLYYLDNFLSTKDGFVFEGELRGLNENYARELLELHTLSVGGPYDQDDVIEVARAFTGWTIAPAELAFLAGPDGFFFWPDSHDNGPKSPLGLDLAAGGGMQDGLDVLAHLASHPSTAAFLCRRLTERFVNENAPQAVLDACTQRYLATDGDLREVMRTILLSGEFLAETHAGAKVKRPNVFMASLVRATEADLDEQALEGLVFYLGLLGESIYLAHPPTGYPDVSAYWSSGGTLMARFNLVTFVTFASEQLGIDWGVEAGHTPEQIADGLIQKLMPGGVDPVTRQSTLDYIASLPPVLRVPEGAAVLLSSPEFARH